MTTVLAVYLYWVFCFVIFIPIYCYLHELAGHYAVDWLSGIPAKQMEISWMVINNIKLFPYAVGVVNGEPPKISYFSGGFVAGLLLLVSTLIFWRLYKNRRQERYWWFFSIALGFACTGFIESTFETLFLEYHRSTVEIIILSLFIFIFPPFVSLWHYRSHIKNMVK